MGSLWAGICWDMFSRGASLTSTCASFFLLVLQGIYHHQFPILFRDPSFYKTAKNPGEMAIGF